MNALDATEFDASTRQLYCRGDWDLAHLPTLQFFLQQVVWPHAGEVTINGQDIHKMDTAGAWLLDQLHQMLQQKGLTVTFIKFSKEPQALLGIVEKKLQEKLILPPVKAIKFIESIGIHTLALIVELRMYLAFIGQLSLDALRIAYTPKRWRFTALLTVIDNTGYAALPIIALLSFLIGVVLTYQMGLQLRNYGANIYIVDLLGVSVLREFGPLITAIMVAGRTGSAFTAQLGMMKLNQEIDALDTMGVTPGELLLLPKIIGLFITLPLLTMWADMFGILGGMVMSNNMLNISWYDFLHRFPSVIPLRSLLLGLGKAPIFALLISSVGCFQGMQVEGGAESIGRNTTRSVVLAIFFIIVADAFFSILFSKLKL